MRQVFLILAAGLIALVPPARAQEAVQAVASRVLLQEAVLSDARLAIPEDGEVRIVLPEGTPETALSLDGFILDPHAGIFAARLVLEDGSRLGLRGQAVVTVPAMVPVRRLSPGEVITDADLAPAEIPLASLPGTAVRLSDEIVGKEVQRALAPDRPVLASALREPRAIRRGDQVLISYSRSGIDLTAPGRALQDGVLGQELRVVNLASNRSITAIAAGPGHVTAD